MATFPVHPYDTHQTNLGIAQAPVQSGPAPLSAAVADKLSKALGQAIIHCWSRLPRDIQHDLFEAAVASEGEAIRQQLAIYLHGTHVRTSDSLRARAMPEPDSLGG